MKLHLIRLLGASALVASLGAWAQAPSGLSEALIDVVPFGAEIDLNNTVDISPDADPQGVESSRFGRAVAKRAQEGGEDFGQAVAAAASANAGRPDITIPKPPAAQ